jgi:hypothetical protein
MGLIMLPLMLLGWLFGGPNGWKVFPGASDAIGIKKIVDDVVKDTCGIALVGLFSGVALMLIGALVGADGTLATALAENDSGYLMDSLSLGNNSLTGVVFAGLFIGMFMHAVPALTDKLFDGFKTPDIRTLQESLEKFVKNAAQQAANKIKMPTKSSGGPHPPSGGSTSAP